MKKSLLILFLFVLVTHLYAAETMLLDFETATVPVTVSSWQNYSKSGSTASTWGAANPKSDAVNSTIGCYKVVKTSADPYWTGLEVTLSNVVTITSANQYLHVLVYKNTGSRIAITYTPDGGSQSSDAWQSNATTSNWIDYVLTIPVGTKLKTFALKIADDAGDYYFDQIVLSDTGTSRTRTIVTVNPTQKGQILEGWGGSLCWWANIMGGFSDSKVKTICDWITDPVNGLNMNVFRFNIGGGDDPTHNHMRTDGGNMPGYKLSATATYDWNQDANQRRIMQQLIASRIAKAGVNDIQIVAFSNSPPYWMTRSGCSAGSVEGNVTNLKADMFDDFADYLTEVTRYYHDSLGITFNYLEPFNEPEASWWKALGGQEGCYFSNNDQIKLIREVYSSLEKKNMLSYCRITANDANTIDHTYNAVQAYKSAGDILPLFDLISTHSYGGSNRSALATWAQTHNKKLWQSESGPLSVGGTNEHQIMVVADRIITDLRDLKCTAWCDWQIGATGNPTNNPWGLIIGEYDNMLNPIARNINYYIRAQYSRYLKSGYSIVGSSTANSLAALSPDEKELVLVISNSALFTQKYTLDLSKFSDFGRVKQFRTRADESLGVKTSQERFSITGNSIAYDAQPHSVATYVIPINQVSSVQHTATKTGSLFYANGHVITRFDTDTPIEISVFNLAGQNLVHKKMVEPRGTTNMPLQKGIYLITTRIKEERQTFKIVVDP